MELLGSFSMELARDTGGFSALPVSRTSEMVTKTISPHPKFERAQVLQRCSTGSATLCSSGESMQKQWLPCSICLAAVQAQSPQELLGRKEKYAL